MTTLYDLRTTTLLYLSYVELGLIDVMILGVVGTFLVEGDVKWRIVADPNDAHIVRSIFPSIRAKHEGFT